jgi:hypothetical protein
LKDVTILLYESEPTKSRDERELTETLNIQVDSDKRLTSARALKIIERTLTRFTKGVVIETELGWEASRTIEPSENCAYHFRWEYAVVLKDPVVKR